MPGNERDEEGRPPANPAEHGRRPATTGRRELDAIFGDVLPDTTSDERDSDAAGGDREAWYRENRPPHHDR